MTAAPPFRRPLGLALSGGGVLGAWQTAILCALEARYGLTFDAVIGFSAGALNGANYMLNRMGAALDYWRSIDGSVLKLRPRLRPFSLFSNRSIWDAVDYTEDDARAREAARCGLTVISTLKGRGHHYARFSPKGHDGWDGPLARHLVASCSIPVAFPPVALSVDGRSWPAIDGGIVLPEPYSFEALGFCSDVIVLEMVRREELNGGAGKWLTQWDRHGRVVSRTLMDQGVASLHARPRPPRIYRVGPSAVLPQIMLDFKARTIASLLARGFSDADGFMADPARHLDPVRL